MYISVILFRESLRDAVSVERDIARLISPRSMPFFWEMGPWLSQGVIH